MSAIERYTNNESFLKLWVGTMDDEKYNMLKMLVNMRQEAIFSRLNSNPRYLEVCVRQEKTEDKVEELFRRFKKDERIAIRRHYEGELEKQSFESDEAYLQGLRDCAQFLMFLGILSRETY